MSYIRIDKGLVRKPKFCRIQRETGLPVHELVGYLVLIWTVVDELGEDFEGSDEDIACAVCAPSALVCALCAAGWATRFEGGVTFHSNDPAAHDRTMAHRERAKRAYARRKAHEEEIKAASLRAESAPLCASAPPLPSPPLPTPTIPTEAQAAPASAPTRDKSRSKPKDAIGWTDLLGWVGISEADRTAWRAAYPAVDLDRQLAAMHAWLQANPAKARKSNWRKFATNWLSRAQDRGGDVRANRPEESPTAKIDRREAERKALFDRNMSLMNQVMAEQAGKAGRR